MSFRGEFANKINVLYRETAIKKKSLDIDWRRIQGYFRSFIEEIADVTEFACASVTETESELVLAVEGCELAFRRQENHLVVVVNGHQHDLFFPTVDGFCTNYQDKKVLELMDEYMRAAFQATMDSMQ